MVTVRLRGWILQFPPPHKHSGLIIGWKDSELTETVIVLFTGYNLLQGEDTG